MPACHAGDAGSIPAVHSKFSVRAVSLTEEKSGPLQFNLETEALFYNDSMKRQCSKCAAYLDEASFTWRDKVKGIRHKYCSDCQKRLSKAHYEKNKHKYLLRNETNNKRQLESLQTKILTYLRTKRCVDCGESDPVVLEFDHVRGEKDREIAKMIGNKVSWRKIEVEISKCEIRCANCHRRITAKRLNSYRYRACAAVA